MAKLKTFQVCEIAKDTYAINEAGMAAMFLVVGEKRALLIDTGVGMTDLRSLIVQLTDRPYDVVLTHGHMDHVGGAAQFDQVYIHPADGAALSPVDYGAVADYVEKMIQFGATDVYDCSPQDIKRLTKMPEVKYLRDGMIFNLGGRILKVIETPGHTAGSCSLIDVRERILFSGDACNVNLLCMWESIETLLSGLRAIKAHEHEFDRNFNGHIGYAGMPMMISMPDSVLSDAIHICESILEGSAYIERGDAMGRPASVVTYGNVRICFDKDRLRNS
ncbi:MBL fold metallo-hydrolase [Catenibacillus scindens]|uniref:MBL fold metallo-hydrolase n=1 Tax=Catenibacillus scindens TaxID=673271 RepID=UPI003209753D